MSRSTFSNTSPEAFAKTHAVRLLGLGILAVLPVLASCGDRRETSALAPADSGVGTVNGLPVSEAEYRLVMDFKTAEVVGEFYRTQGLEDHPGYWNGQSGKGTPIFRLRELVRDELARIKVIQGLAKEKGLLPDPSFREFQAAFERENARRSEAKRTGEIVYGPARFSLASFYFIRQGDLEYKVGRILADQAEGEITDADIARFRRENPELAKKAPPDEEMRKRIRRILADREAGRRIEALRAAARVELKEDRVRAIVPREDPGFEAARGASPRPSF
jgi:hypothetical protein